MEKMDSGTKDTFYRKSRSAYRQIFLLYMLMFRERIENGIKLPKKIKFIAIAHVFVYPWCGKMKSEDVKFHETGFSRKELIRFEYDERIDFVKMIVKFEEDKLCNNMHFAIVVVYNDKKANTAWFRMTVRDGMERIQRRKRWANIQ